MLKKTVTYDDPFNPGETITEDLYFNLTKAELVEMEMSTDGEGLQEHLQKIANSNNGKQIMDEMKGIILKAYGKREGNSFIKTDAVREAFGASEAYSELFMEMVTNADAAVEFVNGIMPKGMGDENQEQLPVDSPNLTSPRILTRAEALEIPDLQLGIKQGRYILEN